MNKSTEKDTKNAESTQQQAEQYGATAKYIPYSPYKLRPIADIVRGKDVLYALRWLTTYRTRRVQSIKKVLESAVANAKNRNNVDSSALMIKEICVDQGPIQKYFKPGAQGRAQIQRRRLCHISVTLQTKS
ncbi:50S ribosomal protein L22 [Candidatus Dependentiae bacterium]|nr:50S ribosomal protein L22 [Candidatus Dependentiae bacterium]